MRTYIIYAVAEVFDTYILTDIPNNNTTCYTECKDSEKGTILGTVLNILTNDMLMSDMLYSIGITHFHTNYTVWNILIPCLWICTCTFVYAWLASGKIKRVSCRMLIQE